jgi:hypothetical protein
VSAVAFDLLAEARRHGVRLIATPAGTIKASARKEPPPDLLAKLKAHRPELIAALAGDKTDEFNGRSAIIEHDGGIPRKWAEGYARLDPNRPPGDVPLKRWQRFVDDVGKFLDSQFCAIAAALGWGPFELFGCDRDRPFARIDQAGLLWLLNGDRLVALSENTATIETRTSARRTWRRKPGAAGRVLAWELGRMTGASPSLH